MTNGKDLCHKWHVEYERGGIPSSVRTTPSTSVVWAFGELKKSHQILRTAMDVGCGKGRNSLYLAEKGLQVTAMDFTPNAIEFLQHEVETRGMTDKIRPIVSDATELWPVAEASMDFIIDAFCFKHITLHAARMTYKRQLLRALRSHGHYMISFASVGDGYYGQYVVDRIDGEEMLVSDPVNGIESVLYSRNRVLRFFGPELVLFREIENTKPSTMHGTEYHRQYGFL